MIMSSEFLLGLFIYISGSFVLLSQWKHILNILLSFEIMMLGVILLFLFTLGLNSGDYSLVMVLVVFGVCEASLGLALLVSLIRVHGNDYVSSLSLYKL
uniref:NADH-ubiquinone oxidoreductase chain 4L n=1 Tax=Idiosepius hallami TaxID=2043216 RepID=X2CVD0_9MOLL|nr:NADH dehydrogenase subunit 4L [Idiosepius hallami]